MFRARMRGARNIGKIFSVPLKKSLRVRFTSGVVVCYLASSSFGIRMPSHVFRELDGAILASGTEGSAVISLDLGILASDQSVNAKTRQRIIDLYDQLRPSLQAYLCCLGMTSDQAEDVIQEAFLRLVGHRFEQDSTHNLRAWIFRVAHNLSVDIHRSQRRSSYGNDVEFRQAIQARADPRPSPEQQVRLDEQMQRVVYA